MHKNYTVVTDVQGRRANQAAGHRVMLDGLEDRTFFAANPAMQAMPVMHMHPAVVVEIVPVQIGTGAWGQPRIGFEVIVINQPPMFMAPPMTVVIAPPGVVIQDPTPIAGNSGGDDRGAGGSHSSGSASQNVAVPAMQMANADAATATVGNDRVDSVLPASGKAAVRMTVSAEAPSVDISAASADNLKVLEAAPTRGDLPASSLAAADVQGTSVLSAGMLSGFPAAFPAGLMGWVQSVRPVADAMNTLTAISMPASIHGVFSAAGPTELLKSAAPGVLKALSNIGALTGNADDMGVGNVAAWRSAAVVGVGLAVAGYGYVTAQKRKAAAEEAAAAAAGKYTRKEWDLQAFDDRE
jgi:hypothetical protein